jgi:hypothetical protein
MEEKVCHNTDCEKYVEDNANLSVKNHCRDFINVMECKNYKINYKFSDYLFVIEV